MGVKSQADMISEADMAEAAADMISAADMEEAVADMISAVTTWEAIPVAEISADMNQAADMEDQAAMTSAADMEDQVDMTSAADMTWAVTPVAVEISAVTIWGVMENQADMISVEAMGAKNRADMTSEATPAVAETSEAMKSIPTEVSCSHLGSRRF